MCERLGCFARWVCCTELRFAKYVRRVLKQGFVAAVTFHKRGATRRARNCYFADEHVHKRRLGQDLRVGKSTARLDWNSSQRGTPVQAKCTIHVADTNAKYDAQHRAI